MKVVFFHTANSLKHNNVFGREFFEIYDKWDDYKFEIVHFPFLNGDVLPSPSYGVYMSQLIRFARVCSNVDDCSNRNLFLTAKLLKQGYRYHKIQKAFYKFYHRRSELIVFPRRSRRDIVLASSVHSVRPSIRPSVRLSCHTFCLSRTISQYLLVRFDSFLVQMINFIDSRYPISLVKIDHLTLELLPLFWYRQL